MTGRSTGVQNGGRSRSSATGAVRRRCTRASPARASGTSREDSEPRHPVPGRSLGRRCTRAAGTCAKRESDHQVDAHFPRKAGASRTGVSEPQRKAKGGLLASTRRPADPRRARRVTIDSRPCRPDSRVVEDPYSRADDAALFRYLLRRVCRRRGGTDRVAICCDLSCTRATDIGERRSGASSARVGRLHIIWQRTRGRAVRPDSRDRVARPSVRRRSSRTALRCRIIAVALPGS